MMEGAKNEIAWAKGQLRGVKGVSTLDAIADGAPSKRDEPAEAEEPAEETTRFAEREGGTALRPQVSDEWATPRAEPARTFTPPSAPSRPATDDPWAAPPPVAPSRSNASEQQVREITLENDPWATIPTPPTRSWTADHQMADEADEKVEAQREDRHDHETALSNESAPARVQSDCAPKDDQHRAVFFRVPAPETSP